MATLVTVMILSPIEESRLTQVLAAFESCLGPSPVARAAWVRIVASRQAMADIETRTEAWLAQAIQLCRDFGMAPLLEAPAESFSWDGRHVRALTEPAVLVHEVAHYQLAAPRRRRLPDFGLGAGPETGEIAIADRARAVGDARRESEEQMASLLGILWETALGQPGILAFQEQNWLEGAGRPSTTAFFEAVVARLHQGGFIDDDARPLMTLSIMPDEAIQPQAVAA